MVDTLSIATTTLGDDLPIINLLKTNLMDCPSAPQSCPRSAKTGAKNAATNTTKAATTYG